MSSVRGRVAKCLCGECTTCKAREYKRITRLPDYKPREFKGRARDNQRAIKKLAKGKKVVPPKAPISPEVLAARERRSKRSYAVKLRMWIYGQDMALKMCCAIQRHRNGTHNL